MPPLKSSKELLRLENQAPASSVPLLAARSNSRSRKIKAAAETSPPTAGNAPPTTASHVLERVKSFLPVMGAANARLEHSLRERPAGDFDIEVLSGGDGAAHIEMDLALGVAELQSAAAVEAAERALTSGQTAIAEDSHDGRSSSSSSSAEEGPIGQSHASTDRSLLLPVSRREREASGTRHGRVSSPSDDDGGGSVCHLAARPARRSAGRQRLTKKPRIEEL